MAGDHFHGMRIIISSVGRVSRKRAIATSSRRSCGKLPLMAGSSFAPSRRITAHGGCNIAGWINDRWPKF
jgi:hypothetical protein